MTKGASDDASSHSRPAGEVAPALELVVTAPGEALVTSLGVEVEVPSQIRPAGEVAPGVGFHNLPAVCQKKGSRKSNKKKVEVPEHAKERARLVEAVKNRDARGDKRRTNIGPKNKSYVSIV